MKPTVYIETTIVSYLTCWPSKDPLRLSHEELTRLWWSTALDRFELYTSPLVLQEAGGGDPDAAVERLKSLQGIPSLALSDEVIALAESLAQLMKLPDRARADSVHLAVAAVHGMAYLLTWNCRHLANAALADIIERACERAGLLAPRVCTPEQLMELP